MIKVAFCIPGQTFSNTFLQCWTDLLLSCPQFGVQPICPVFPYISNVYISRNVCLLGFPEHGLQQKPFQGKINYDYLMWIDSDSEFSPLQFRRLLETMQQRPDIQILSGVYMHGNCETLTTFDREGVLLTPTELRLKPALTTVLYTGMGFMMVRKGVFERLNYPWFVPIVVDDGQGNVVDIMGDDTSFCERTRQLGIETWIATAVQIGHEKPRVLKVSDYV